MKWSPAKQLALVLFAALGLRLAAGWVWQGRLEGRFGFGDSQTYWVLARAIAQGQPYQYGQARVFRTPGYPLVLAPLFLACGGEPPVMWARAESALLGTLAVAGVWGLARQLFDAPTAAIAAWIAAFYPGAVAIGALVLSEAAFCPLILAQLILWTAAWRASTARRSALLSVGAGLAAGAAALMRPSWLLFTPFALILGLVAGKQRLRHLEIGAAMLAGLALAMTPWWVRNARVTGRFVPTTLQVGASLYDGLNPLATGASNMAPVDRASARFAESQRGQAGRVSTLPSGPNTADAAKMLDAQETPEMKNSPHGGGDTFEYRLDRHLRAEAWAWVGSDPGRALELVAIKFARLWNFWPNEAAFSAWPIRLAVLLTYVPVMVLAAIGTWRTIHCGWPYVLCWLPAVYFTLLHVVFVSSIRYRQPAMLTLIVLAAGVVATRWKEGSDTV